MPHRIKINVFLILRFICKLAALVWPYTLAIRYRLFLTRIHTYWISSELRSMGESSLIGYPVTLFGGRHISIGDNVYLGIRGTLTSWYSYNGDIFNPSISIGDNTSIGDEYHITAINQIHIGCNVLMGKKITITDNSHGEIDFDSLLLSPIDRHLISKGAVIIEDNVWIGDKVTILPNIRIGKNAIIGANSVVTKDIPENSVAAGIPAGVIKILR